MKLVRSLELKPWLMMSVVVMALAALPVRAAEHDRPSAKQGGTESSDTAEKKRSASSTDLSKTQVDLISSLFELPEALVKDRYGTTLPEAIEKARSKKDGAANADGIAAEEPIAKILAELVTTRGNDLMKSKVMPKIQEEIKKEEDKDGSEKNRYLDFLKRVLWAGKVIEGEDSAKPEAQAFNKAFRDAIKKNQADVKEVMTKVKDALEGNKSAKEYLRDKINRASFPAFLDSQRKAGNEKIVADFAKAVSWNDNGKQVLYLKGKDNQIKTLPIGNTPSDIMSALKDFGDQNGGFQNYALSLYPPATPAPQASPKPGEPTAQTGGALNDTTGLAALQKSCAPCHTERAESGIKMDGIGSVTGKGAMFASAIEGGRMPKGNPGFKDTAEGKALVQWLKTK
jgi:hypothetical protein